MFSFPTAFLDDPEFFLKCLAGLGALVAFSVGLHQYHRSQLWKRKEFLGAEVATFLRDPDVRNALLMVDWSARRIPFDRTSDRSSWPRVTRETQVAALQPHILRTERQVVADGEPRRFSSLEAQIRDTFDTFLDGLERLHAFSESGLYDTNELTPYLRYWVRDMTRTDGSAEDARWRLALLTYVHFYEFTGVQRLLGALAVDVRVGGPLWRALSLRDPDLARSLESTVLEDS